MYKMGINNSGCCKDSGRHIVNTQKKLAVLVLFLLLFFYFPDFCMINNFLTFNAWLCMLVCLCVCNCACVSSLDIQREPELNMPFPLTLKKGFTIQS